MPACYKHSAPLEPRGRYATTAAEPQEGVVTFSYALRDDYGCNLLIAERSDRVYFHRTARRHPTS